MKFKKDGKVYSGMQTLYDACRTTDCLDCKLYDKTEDCEADMQAYPKTVARLMGYEVIDDTPDIAEVIDDTPDIAEVIEKYGEDVKPDNVNRPAHYTSGGIECIDAMTAAFGDDAVKDFCLCNAFKYLWRHRQKNGVEDLKKCRWYLNRLITEMEAEE